MFVVLKPWNERKGKEHSVEAVMKRINEQCAALQEGIVFAINPPAIPGLGMTSGLEMQLLDINSHGPGEMMQVLKSIQETAGRYPEIASVQSLYEGEVTQYRVNIDRDKIQLMGLNLRRSVFNPVGIHRGELCKRLRRVQQSVSGQYRRGG